MTPPRMIARSRSELWGSSDEEKEKENKPDDRKDTDEDEVRVLVSLSLSHRADFWAACAGPFLTPRRSLPVDAPREETSAFLGLRSTGGAPCGLQAAAGDLGRRGE